MWKLAPGQFEQLADVVSRPQFKGAVETLDGNLHRPALEMNQAEKMMRLMQTKHQDAYEQSSKVMEEWLTTLRKGQDEFRKLVDENFKKAEGYLKTLGDEG